MGISSLVDVTAGRSLDGLVKSAIGVGSGLSSDPLEVVTLSPIIISSSHIEAKNSSSSSPKSITFEVGVGTALLDGLYSNLAH